MVLVALWGSSFLFTALAVDTVDPVSVVFYRLALGAVVLSLVVYARGQAFPRSARVWGGFLLMAIAGNSLPFFLISWGQQTIDSGVAGMIMAIMPLMTMVFAHYFVAGETLNRYKIIGFSLGITGGVPSSKIYKDVFMGQNRPQIGRTFITKGGTNFNHNMIPLYLRYP